MFHFPDGEDKESVKHLLVLQLLEKEVVCRRAKKDDKHPNQDDPHHLPNEDSQSVEDLWNGNESVKEDILNIREKKEFHELKSKQYYHLLTENTWEAN